MSSVQMALEIEVLYLRPVKGPFRNKIEFILVKKYCRTPKNSFSHYHMKIGDFECAQGETITNLPITILTPENHE